MSSCTKCKDGWIHDPDGGVFSCDCERGKEQQKCTCEYCGGFDEHYSDCEDLKRRYAQAPTTSMFTGAPIAAPNQSTKDGQISWEDAQEELKYRDGDDIDNDLTKD